MTVKTPEHGVSPVIGTILMVSITVVLAATIYIMVTGYTMSPAKALPTGNFVDKKRIDDHTYKLVFSDFKPPIRITQVYVLVVINGTQSYRATFNSTSSGVEAAISPQDSQVQGLSIKYYDLAENEFINMGDYLIISGLHLGTRYTITIADADGNQITSTTLEP